MKSIRELIQGVKQRDRRAELIFIHLLENQALDSVRAYISKRNDSADPDSIFNEACAILWENLLNEKFVPIGETDAALTQELSRYLMGISKNLLRNFWRGRSRFHYAGELPEIKQEDVLLTAAEELDDLRRIAWQTTYDTPEPCRGHLTHRYGRKMTYREIGKRESPPVNSKTVKRILAVCMQQLLTRLDSLLKKSCAQIELENTVKTSLADLPERCRDLLLYCYKDGGKASIEELTAALGYKNENTARTAKNECMNELNLAIGERILGNTQTNN